MMSAWHIRCMNPACYCEVVIVFDRDVNVLLMHFFLVADMTAGGCSGEMPVWQMDKNVIIKCLNSAYEEKVVRRSLSYCTSTTCLENRKAALLEFKEFTSNPTSNAPSELYTLLLYEDDNLSIALKWALEKLAMKSSSVMKPGMLFFHLDSMQILHQYTMASSKKLKW